MHCKNMLHYYQLIHCLYYYTEVMIKTEVVGAHFCSTTHCWRKSSKQGQKERRSQKNEGICCYWAGWWRQNIHRGTWWQQCSIVSVWPGLTTDKNNTNPSCMQSTGTLIQSAVLTCDMLKSSRLRTSINRTLTLESHSRRYNPADVSPPGGAALSTLNHSTSKYQLQANTLWASDWKSHIKS